MTLKNYCLGVAILALAAGCGGTIVTGSNNDTNKKDAGNPTAPPSSGNQDMDGGAPTESGAPEAASDTGPVDSGPDHGAPSMTYPAFTPFMPQVIDNGGPVLSAPQVVTISWTSDTSYPTWEAYDDTIGASSYWMTATSEYGVGPAVGGPTNHVEISTAAPTSWSDMDIASFVSTNAGDVATSGWPAPSANTLYAIWLSPTTSSGFTLSGFGNACNAGVGGYHDNVSTSVGDIAYAVILQCGFGSFLSPTALASHELAEAATDPHPSDIPAYTGVDDSKFFAWDAFQGGSGTEVGDMCEVYCNAYYSDATATLGYQVQRIWSNASAAAGHAPCVPAESSPYYNVVPLDPQSITVDTSALGGSAAMPTMGYSVAPGETKTFAIGLYSDGPTPAWDISAQDLGDPIALYTGGGFGGGGSPQLTAKTDLTSGKNGNIAYVTVTVNKTVTAKSDLLIIRSEMPGESCNYGDHHDMPILITFH
jgi:hypothetical protein